MFGANCLVKSRSFISFRYDFFFFFQAEDGIRDVAVTGVQTCALPIFRALFFLAGLFYVTFPYAATFNNQITLSQFGTVTNQDISLQASSQYAPALLDRKSVV